jgi:hypothetical protein
VLLLVAFILELLRQRGTVPAGELESVALLYVQLTLPTALFPFAVAGVLAPPAPFFAGSILGLLDALLITLSVLIDPQARLEGSGVTEIGQGLGPLFVIAVVVGTVVTGLTGYGVDRYVVRRRRPPIQEGVSLRRVEFERPMTLVRSYTGHQPEDAEAPFEADAGLLAPIGYVPVSQSWSQGRWGRGAYVIAVLLFLLIVGFFLFVYLLLVSPDETLTVTYQHRSMPAPAPTLAARLTEPDRARWAGLISDAEYHVKREELLRAH